MMQPSPHRTLRVAKEHYCYMIATSQNKLCCMGLLFFSLLKFGVLQRCFREQLPPKFIAKDPTPSLNKSHRCMIARLRIHKKFPLLRTPFAARPAPGKKASIATGASRASPPISVRDPLCLGVPSDQPSSRLNESDSAMWPSPIGVFCHAIPRIIRQKFVTRHRAVSHLFRPPG